jgi:2-keto-4-pentenoate hydratase/2-oxohepta-3-ene-1,7-dioic acid hydratase in catechol pathway
MRLAVYEFQGAQHLGVVADSSIYPLPDNETVLSVLSADPQARAILDASAREGHPVALADVRLLPPIQPPAMRDFQTFEQHVQGVTKAVQGGDLHPEWYEAPSFLFMNPNAVIGTGDDVEKPYGTEQMDFELEVAAVISHDARNVAVEDAAAHIGGYLIMNDWSARDLMRREMKLGLGPSKGKDFATTLGPWIVTTDELETYRRDDRLDLEMSVAVNGVRVGGDQLSNMAWSFEQMVSYASRGAWLRAGDVLASGTCATGALAESWGRTGRIDPPALETGDVVTMTVQGIGEITNAVVPPGYAELPIPPARRKANH